jgi:putative glycosyltransferase (TIGR04348 family)
MNLVIVTQALPGSLSGNRRTADRWADLLRGLGHSVEIVDVYDGEPCDAMIALHAGRSARSIARFRDERPDAPLVVVLTGTDLYRDIDHDPAVKDSLSMATRIVTLHPLGGERLTDDLRGRLRVILQSAGPIQVPAGSPEANGFQVCILGHLRPVKDPFRLAEAARTLPADSNVQVVQVGKALSTEMEQIARDQQAANPRYRWLGGLPRDEALRILAGSRLMVLTSQMEGGANVIGEAAVHGVPVIASRIAGSVGLLGPDYPGYFEVGDTAGLAALVRRAETEPEFLAELTAACWALAPRFDPAREREALAALMGEIGGSSGLS